MERSNERRKFRRFEIPNAEVQVKKKSRSGLIKHFSKTYPLLNLGVGGLAIPCGVTLRNGEAVILQLIVPGEKPLHLHSKVIWQNPIALSNDMVVGFGFLDFGHNKDQNSPDALNVLRRLYAKYIKD